MSEEAQQALKQALTAARSLEMFPVIQVTLLLVALLLSSYVLKKQVNMSEGIGIGPIRFVLYSLFFLAMGGVFSIYWGIGFALFAFAFALGLAMSLSDPMAAVCFLIANSLLRGWEMSGSAEMSIIPKTMGALSLFCWVFYGIRNRTLNLLFNWPSRFFILFSLWVLISAVTHAEFAQGLQNFNNSMVVPTIVFILIANVPTQDRDMRLLEKTFVLSVTGMIAHAFLVTVSQENFDPSIHRLEDIGLNGNSNDLAALVVQALPLALIPALDKRQKGTTRLIAFTCLPVYLIGLWLAQSRGAILALGLSGLVYFVMRSHKPKRAILFASFCLPVLLGALSLMSFARNSEDLQGSTSSRTAFALAGLRMALHNPLAGVGFGNFPKLFEGYADGMVTFEWGERTAHSTWILALAETGGIGFLFFFGLFASTCKRAWRVRRSYPELLPTLAGYAVAMSFLSHTYTVTPYLLFAMILAAAKLTPRETASIEAISSLTTQKGKV